MKIPERYRGRLLLSARELAELTPFSARHVAGLVERGELRGRKISGQWMIEADSAWAWLGIEGEPPKKLDPLVAKLLSQVNR